ncbi:MAG: hypothetical protein EOO91_06210 [Pedobacter sp.]|nr:MAG: hypothetical protein EOO91_06210 [Pedobacter sp.]
MRLITFNTSIEFICFLAALTFLIKVKDGAWKLLIPYLLLAFSIETAGLYLRTHGISNLELYNGFLILENLMISYFFFNLFKPYAVKVKWLIGWLGVFFTLYIIEIVYSDFKDFVSITASIMSVVFVLASLYFYYLKLKDESYEPLISSASFWWVSGSLFFYFGSTVCNLFFDYLKEYEVVQYNRSVRYVIFNILNVILYSSWIISFICKYRQKRFSH